MDIFFLCSCHYTKSSTNIMCEASSSWRQKYTLVLCLSIKMYVPVVSVFLSFENCSNFCLFPLVRRLLLKEHPMIPGLIHFQVQNYVTILSQCFFNLNWLWRPYLCHQPTPYESDGTRPWCWEPRLWCTKSHKVWWMLPPPGLSEVVKSVIKDLALGSDALCH